MLAFLIAFQEPLQKSGGREFDGAAPMYGRITEQYYAMLNESQRVWASGLRQPAVTHSGSGMNSVASPGTVSKRP